jgi:hypothetical protein
VASIVSPISSWVSGERTAAEPVTYGKFESHVQGMRPIGRREGEQSLEGRRHCESQASHVIEAPIRTRKRLRQHNCLLPDDVASVVQAIDELDCGGWLAMPSAASHPTVNAACS